MADLLLECEQMIFMGGKIGWSTCGAVPARLVTFPRTPPMVLCVEHERDATKNKASGVPAHPKSEAAK